MDNRQFMVYLGTYERLLVGIRVDIGSGNSDTFLSDDATANMEMIVGYAAHISSIKCVSSGGHWLASGGSDEIIKIYDMNKLKEVGTLHSHSGTITALRFYGSRIMFGCSADGLIHIYRTRDFELLKSLGGHKSSIVDFAVHPTGRLALSVDSSCTIKMWDLTTCRFAFTTKLHAAHPLALSKRATPAEKLALKLLMRGAKDLPEAICWNGAGTSYAIRYPYLIDVYHLNKLSTQSTDTKSVNEKDDDNGAQCLQISVDKGEQRYLCCTFHRIEDSEEEYIFAGCDDGMCRIYSISKDNSASKLLQTLKLAEKRIKAVETVKGSDFLVTASSDGIVRVWDIKTLLNFDSSDGNMPPHLGEHDTGARITCMTVQSTDSISTSGLESVTTGDESFLLDSLENDEIISDEESEKSGSDNSDEDESSSESEQEEVIMEKPKQGKKRISFAPSVQFEKKQKNK